jgi:hypothetical protein
MVEYRLKRSLSCFRNSDDRMDHEIALDHVDFEVLKRIVGPAGDDPDMIFEYNVTPEMAEALKEHIQEEFDYSQFSYFVSCWRED